MDGISDAEQPQSQYGISIPIHDHTSPEGVVPTQRDANQAPKTIKDATGMMRSDAVVIPPGKAGSI